MKTKRLQLATFGRKGGCPRFPKKTCIFSRLGMHACLSASKDVSVFTME